MHNKNLISGVNVYKIKLLHGVAYSRLHTYLAETLHPFNISIPEWKLIGQLHEHGNMRLSDLTNWLSYEPPMVTTLVKQMEMKGLLERISDQEDERVKIVKLTPSGNILIKTVEPEVIKAMDFVFNGITHDELSIYVKVLSTIIKNTNNRSIKSQYLLTYE